MQRNMDLFREILLKVEADPQFDGSFHPVSARVLGIEDCSSEEFAYHCQLLHEAGLLQGNFKIANQGAIILSRLTNAGHEFLDTTRNPEIWRKIKEGASKIGGAGIELLLALGKAYAKQFLQEKLGIHLS
jgi:hypothetical protein